jgi:hypothetical protein
MVLDILPRSWRFRIAKILYALHIRTDWVMWYWETSDPQRVELIIGKSARDFFKNGVTPRKRDIH